jgi:peptide-methionine (S)-S-oxide reductase
MQQKEAPMRRPLLFILAAILAAGVSLGAPMKRLEHATFGSGCFWCSEAVFERLPGVKGVVAGYAGGNVPNPTYEAVSSGRTGHAEVVQITYDPDSVSYAQLLDLFWQSHDPTSLNRQGADAGTQYRSIILYDTDEQRAIAERTKAEVQKNFSSPIVTEIVPLKTFYKAEDYHQDYFANNPDAPYCIFVIKPKLDKLDAK